MTRKAFNKPARTAVDLVAFLREKGLSIPDSAYAEHCLSYIGYYRLKIYTRPFEDASKRFRPGVEFSHIVEVYDFDRRLRLMCLDAIERIEVALRSHIINIMGRHGGPHFYYEERFFTNKDAVTNMRKLGESGKHLSITHYKNEYHSPYLPAIWCLMEASTFGQISKLFADLELSYRKEIARAFGLDETICVSWFRSIATIRNTCAHHGRVFNAEMRVDMPKKAQAYAVELADNTNLYSRLVIMRVFLKRIDPNGAYGWLPRLMDLIDDRPASVALADMGIPNDWKTRQLWQ